MPATITKRRAKSFGQKVLWLEIDHGAPATVIASEAKQAIVQQGKVWIASSLRSSQ